MRSHWFGFVLNEEGNPIENCTVKVYLAGTEILTNIFQQETGGFINDQTTNTLLTNGAGYYEFWIADSSELYGYARNQKFKITWEKTGIADGMIDYIDIFATGYDGVDETDGTSSTKNEKNKLLSNFLAYTWEYHRLNTITIGASGSNNPHNIILLNENDMTSNSNIAMATQSSIKSYVDNLFPVFINDNVDSPGPIILDTFDANNYTGVYWHYIIKNSSNTAIRSGKLQAHWDINNIQSPAIQYNNIIVNDVGSFGIVNFNWNVLLSGSTINLTLSPTSGTNYYVKVRRYIL